MNKKFSKGLFISCVIGILIIISHVIFLFLTFSSEHIVNFIFRILWAFLLLTFFTLVPVLFFIYDNMLKNEKEHCESLTKTCDELKSFKHDFNNMLQALEGHICNDDLNGAKNYLKSIIKESKNIDTIANICADDINNLPAYNLIVRKYFRALDFHITFHIELLDDLKQDSISNFNFCRILGILLDNAVEAAKNCFENKHMILSVFHDDKKNCKSIMIQNTFADKTVDIAKIFEKSYSTKPGNTGIGLWKVKKILKNQFMIHLTTNVCDGYFIQTLDLY